MSIYSCCEDNKLAIFVVYNDYYAIFGFKASYGNIGPECFNTKLSQEDLWEYCIQSNFCIALQNIVELIIDSEIYVSLWPIVFVES